MTYQREIFDILAATHPTADCELHFSSPFELLVAVILSAQCTDKRVNLATRGLFARYNTPEAFASLSLEELKPYIFSCGFYNNKGKNIIATARALVERHGGQVPKDLASLTALPGVGRKTASVVAAVAFGIPAMPVDTHVFRVSRRLGFSAGKTPEAVEKDLCALFPQENWNPLHHYLIFHGRYICHAQKPNCGVCKLTPFCPYYQENKDANRVKIKD